MAQADNEQLKRTQQINTTINTQRELQQQQQQQIFQQPSQITRQTQGTASKQAEDRKEEQLYGLPKQLNENLIQDGISRFGVAPSETLPSENPPLKQDTFPVRSIRTRKQILQNDPQDPS